MKEKSTPIAGEARAAVSGAVGKADAIEMPPSGASPAEPDWPSRRLAWTALILLMVGAIISTLDRGIIQLLVEPIKAEYGLSDTQFGALQSIAFGTFYVTMAIPLGILADRYQRRLVIGIGVSVFSLFALGTGFARNYTQLFVARMGVGIGEASLSPAAYSLLGDYFPPSKYGRAVSLFIMSNFIGSAIALAGGGLLIGWLIGLAARDPDALFGFAPWQGAIILAALPGVLLAPFFFLLREPARRGLAGKPPRISFRDMLQELGNRRRFLILLIGGMAVATFMNNALSSWTPALFIRVYGWTATEIGLWMGGLLLFGGVVGSFAGGWLSDWLYARGRLQAPIEVAAFSFIAAGLLGVAAPLMPTPELSLACFLPIWVLKPMAFTCAPAAIQFVTPNQLRGQLAATYLTFVNLVGLGLGPIIVGVMTDQLFTDPTDVRYSLAIICALTVPVMAWLLLSARRPYRRLLETMG